MIRLGLSLLVVLIGVSVTGWAVPESSKHPVRLNVSPHMGFDGQALCVKVTVPKHADNRILATAIDCDRFYRSWQEQINGDQSPYERRHCFEKMPQGRCAIGVSLFRMDAAEKNGVATFRANGESCFAGMDVTC